MDSIKDEKCNRRDLAAFVVKVSRHLAKENILTSPSKKYLMLLGRCEFGKEDYSLNIINLPNEKRSEEENDGPDFEGTTISVQEMAENNNKKGSKNNPTLFD
ncbi:MAG: hypothetical protein R2879_05985 [Saprospiraceae bacterium]